MTCQHPARGGRGGEVIRDNHLFQIHRAVQRKGVRQAPEEHTRTNLPPLPLVDKDSLFFLTPPPPSILLFPSFLLVPWPPSSSLKTRGRSSRLRITLLFVLVAARLVLEVSLIPRRINATRPGWITTTINFIERTISYGGYRARRERNFRDTWRDKGGGGVGGGSYLASKIGGYVEDPGKLDIGEISFNGIEF